MKHYLFHVAEKQDRQINRTERSDFFGREFARWVVVVMCRVTRFCTREQPAAN